MPDIDPTTLPDEQLAALLREAGRRSAAKRKRVDKACEMCGTMMHNALTTQRLCSNACSMKAFRAREREKRQAARQQADPTYTHRQRLAARGWLPTTKEG